MSVMVSRSEPAPEGRFKFGTSSDEEKPVPTAPPPYSTRGIAGNRRETGED